MRRSASATAASPLRIPPTRPRPIRSRAWRTAGPARRCGADFIILLAEADGTALETTAERFRMLVTRSGLFADHRHIDLSISIGGTLVTPGDDPAKIIQRTSTLLRQSTSGGRNRVTLYAV
ncbi:MAG: GGDEF domain-containing protein [Solirubrobacteraceae bacterium]